MITTREPSPRSVALLVTGILVGLIGASRPATAGWMAGASLGESKTYNYEVGGPIDSIDDTDTAFRVFFGHSFFKFFGVVTSYVDLGKMTAEGPAFGGFTDELDSSAWDLSGLGMLPISKRFGVFGSMGVCRWKQKVHYVDPSGVYNYNDSGNSLSYGAGANLNLLPANLLGLHLEWQRFTNVGDKHNSGHQYDRDMISLGLVVRFL